MRALIDHYDFVPRTCTWELTLRCNLNCGHCGSRAGRARPQEMGRDRMLRAVGELAALGCQRITLSGGEPTLSEHWQAVASEGARLGVKMNMITNGVTAGRDFVRDAKSSGLVNLGVSLDGLEEQHDRVRGRRGLYRNVMELLDQAAAEKLPIGVITTIHKANYRQLEAIHDRIAGRVFVWQVQIGAAMGNLADHRLEQQVVPQDLLEIVPAIASLIEKGKVQIRASDNVGYYGPYEKTIRKSRSTPIQCWTGCYAGCRHVGIEADGGVKGCLSIQASKATEGNLQDESLIDIWRKPGAFAYNRQFKHEDLGGFCAACVHAEICRGGCLSMRTCEGGRENPFCYHRVATLAERSASRSRARYIPLAIAPAALLALAGCSSEPQPDAPAYNMPVKDAAPDTKNDADADQPITDAYGLPPDVVYYGIDSPLYGVDAPIPSDAVYYGIDSPTDPLDAPIPSDAVYYGIDSPPDVPEEPDAAGD
ncbi:MAG: radical SAM protein [Deltaproteobacteria bacterium]|nr:radical SAM protein [Deltaproteobacteria bacterium]